MNHRKTQRAALERVCAHLDELIIGVSRSLGSYSTREARETVADALHALTFAQSRLARADQLLDRAANIDPSGYPMDFRADYATAGVGDDETPPIEGEATPAREHDCRGS